MDNNISWTFFLLCFLVGRSWTLTCNIKSNCVFQTDKGQVDLNPLAPDDNPTFKLPPTPKEYTFYFNPCKNFNLEDSKGSCSVVNGCQEVKSLNTSSYYPLGDISSMKCLEGTEESDFIIQYTKDPRTTMVTVRCGNQDKFEYIDESPLNQYKFVLATRHACFGGKGLSVGSIMCIVFFVTLLVYFILGAAFMFWARESRGTDIIPNKDFWSSLPGLIKDGVSFTIGKCCGTSDIYGQI